MQIGRQALCSTFREDLRLVPWQRSVPGIYLLAAEIPSNAYPHIA